MRDSALSSPRKTSFHQPKRRLIPSALPSLPFVRPFLDHCQFKLFAYLYYIELFRRYQGTAANCAPAARNELGFRSSGLNLDSLSLLQILHDI